MPLYRKTKRGDWIKSLLFIGIYVAVISITAFILLVTYWYMDSAGSRRTIHPNSFAVSWISL